MHLMDRVIYFNLAKLCDQDYDKSFNDIVTNYYVPQDEGKQCHECHEILSDRRALSEIFRRIVVPNPLFWIRFLKKQMWFIGIEAPSRRYDSLLKLIEEFQNTSYYVCYSQTDIFLRAIGEEEELEELRDLITERGYVVRTHLVRDIPVFYRFQVPHMQSSMLENPEFEPEELDNILSETVDQNSLPIISSLKEQGVVLGTLYQEDHYVTGRIRAFVGVKLNDDSMEIISRFQESLLDLNQKEKARGLDQPLVSAYQCATRRFSYLIELICDDQVQLDRVTDQIQSLHAAVDDTNTMIIAKYNDRPFSYSDKTSNRIKSHSTAMDLSLSELQPRLDRIHTQLSEEVFSLFITASSTAQLLALNLYGELEHLAQKHPSLGNIMECSEPIIRAILKNQIGELKNVGLGLIRDVIETKHLGLAKILIKNVFSSNPSQLQATLKTSNAQYWKWGLRVWGEQVYGKWNDHRFFKEILVVPESIIWSLCLVGRARNEFAHSREAEFEETLQKVRETIRHGASILIWIEEAKEKLLTPTVPVQKAWDFIKSGEKSSFFKLMLDIKGLQIDTLDLLHSNAIEIDKQLSQLAMDINSIKSNIEFLDSDIIERMEEIVLPKLQDQDRKAVSGILQYIQSSAASIPPGVIASLLATIIAVALKIGS